MSIILLLLCTQCSLNTLVDELDTWKGEGARILLYGTTSKAHDGFIFIGWSTPIPEYFRQKLRGNEIILDYFVFGSSIATTRVPA